MISARTRSRLWYWWARLWTTRPLARFIWPHDLRCDGYAPCGLGRDGRRTHLARYCVRWRAHYGICLALVNSYGEPGDADFYPEGGGPAARRARAYEQRLDFPPVREADWRDDPCAVCGRSGTCDFVFCYSEEDDRDNQTRGA